MILGSYFISIAYVSCRFCSLLCRSVAVNWNLITTDCSSHLLLVTPAVDSVRLRQFCFCCDTLRVDDFRTGCLRQQVGLSLMRGTLKLIASIVLF